MRKLWSILLTAVLLASLLFVAVQAEDWDDEEISLDALLNPVTPPPGPGDTPAPTAEPSPSPEPVLQADGSVLITLTAVGDVTIGRNVQHSGASIFEKS